MIVDVVRFTVRRFLNINPYQAPTEQVRPAKDRRKFLVAALMVMISGVICAAPAVLAGCAWCIHFYMDYTGGYEANSFSWYMLAVDLTWIAAACFAFVAVGGCVWRGSKLLGLGKCETRPFLLEPARIVCPRMVSALIGRALESGWDPEASGKDFQIECIETYFPKRSDS